MKCDVATADDETTTNVATYVDLHDWCSTLLSNFCSQHPDFKTNLRRNMGSSGSGCVVTTNYSGIGCFEIACGIVHSCLEGAGLISPEDPQAFRMYSACDVDAVCLRVLEQHQPPFQHEHVFMM